ncbi:MAG TPA: aminoacetone oxidase family FAD-binding enzyme, partial [Acholeplasmataceae bacterium]|nr:aminoacetone oxidase family FAD-binding enzyme [Acholeplasmataceae bacterium]
MKKVYVVGAGPAGLMAAISAKTHYPNFEVTILERNDVIGKKLRLTGGGRCNVTCNIPIEEFIEYTPKNPKFIYSTLQNFNAKHIMDFFKQAGCPLKQEDHNRMFPKSNKSIDIVNTLMKKLQELKIKVEYGVLVHEVKNDVKTLLTSKGEFKYDYLIIATGGKTYPHTGSDGTGYDLAKQLGHTITPLIPAEVPLVSNDPVIQSKTLQGLSFKDVSLTVGKKRLIHDLIFTHFGISGPVALRASYYVQEL